ncbi:amylo-alpha-1,6-glucosidase [Lichenifustis flavocetrariae]|uniref:Amylo-alpha-1,6-glucosidase n=1 Tax=Lichenifustis flavocetrariae TaxID=2949735 RepID=A0AA41Z2Q3_9HYPH|nr:glycogen debranching N-terminal domain-containing protein [Lichenifustis flavocetrariae]MCW6511773.1 amylo-alpha-1,6-glucosidase [Lichenifustis flavocetrariae]
MTLEIKVGPPQLAVHQGYTVMVSDPDGQISVEGDKGLYFLDTRLISAWAMFADGVPWKLLNGGALSASAARIYCTNLPILTAGGTIAENTLGLVFGRHIDGGMHEDVDIINYGATPVCFSLELAIRSDFADLFEVKGKTVTRRGQIRTDWSPEKQALTTTYSHEDFSRALKVTAINQHTAMTYANGRLNFTVDIEPGASWHTGLLYDFASGETWSKAPKQAVADYMSSDAMKAQKRWADSVLKVETENQTFATAFAQAIDDMSALRLPIEGTDHLQFVPAAGLPWFVALFGRDSLIISLQNAIVHPEFARGALLVMAQWQATERDDYRDAEPGKIHHELRRGELAHFKLIPHTPYYGTADATPLYLITLHTAWTCTGDRTLLAKHLDTAERCLAWIDRYGDRDGDGFQEYETRSPVGYANQGWKDSGDAVMNVDGSLVQGPKALCELQGYVYDAWLRMAQIYDALENRQRAGELRRKAAVLFDQFNATFWNEAEGFYAFALDGDKKPVMSIASNPGQCLWSGIVPPDRARRVADRLMQPDMWSGWGIRTLSAGHKGFNPYNYQTGAVWPHDNGFIAQGMKRYGFHDETCRVAEAITRAAGYFAMDQMPELYAGTQRDDSNFPVQYIGANVPQGWAAGSIFSLLQAMLGFQPDAPNGKLYVDPALPDWMSSLTVRDLRVGAMSFNIRFERKGGRTDFAVIEGPQDAVVRRSMADWARGLRSGS